MPKFKPTIASMPNTDTPMRDAPKFKPTIASMPNTDTPMRDAPPVHPKNSIAEDRFNNISSALVRRQPPRTSALVRRQPPRTSAPQPVTTLTLPHFYKKVVTARHHHTRQAKHVRKPEHNESPAVKMQKVGTGQHEENMMNYGID